MTPASVRQLARQLLAREEQVAEPDPVAAFQRTCAVLKADLAPLITHAAFEALLWRAVQLAQREFFWLDGVTSDAVTDCTIPVTVVREAVRRHSPQLTEGLAAILGHLLWLLTTLIGSQLTFRAVRAALPDLELPQERPFREGSHDE
ncbi:MAG TPA: hypothetical protein VFX12_07160 [Vicinamibacterales bacterium]|nr:hypothetical protein [Vicinamibacterales bacterium]